MPDDAKTLGGVEPTAPVEVIRSHLVRAAPASGVDGPDRNRALVAIASTGIGLLVAVLGLYQAGYSGVFFWAGLAASLAALAAAIVFSAHDRSFIPPIVVLGCFVGSLAISLGLLWITRAPTTAVYFAVAIAVVGGVAMSWRGVALWAAPVVCVWALGHVLWVSPLTWAEPVGLLGVGLGVGIALHWLRSRANRGRRREPAQGAQEMDQVLAEAERELAVGAAFRDIVSHSPDSLIVHTSGRIVYANPAFCTALRCEDPQELVGEQLVDLVEAIDRAALAEAMYPDGARAESSEFNFKSRNGHRVVLDLSPARSVTFHGQEACAVFGRDVTQRHDELQAKLLLADRMAAVGTLAAGVAHEINNPLAYVSMNLTTLITEFEKFTGHLDPDQRADLEELLSDTVEGTQRVKEIVRDLKAFSRSDDPSHCEVDVRLLLESAIKMAYNEIRHRARMIQSIDQVPTVVANPARLSQVFLNILVNAAQAIKAGNAEENEIEVKVGVDHRGDIEVSVRDTGCGMSADVRRRIFDPFFTSKPVGVGTGLGMYFCHNVVSGIDGAIDVDSAPGKGTTIRVILPPAEKTARAIKRKYLSAQPLSGREACVSDALKILVIDDEQRVGRSIRRMLSSHDVDLATSGSDGMEQLRKHEYDVVLCDLMMPDITGREIYQKISSLMPGFERKVVFITGGAFTPDAREFVDSVKNPVLSKPFDMPELNAALLRVDGTQSQVQDR